MIRILLLINSLTATSPIVLAHDGYEDLVNPTTLNHCCGGQDCAPTQTRIKDGKLQAYITSGKFWVDVPDEAIMSSDKNPVAGPSVCWHHWEGGEGKVMCFLPGRGM